ncbi:MAG: type II toxin-antitoxin system HicA family toxin [Gammaproteobacteria bacterium]|nr:type II toxin-antitoxin system HicA family toxin [Gammaproteobacteria bacterium]
MSSPDRVQSAIDVLATRPSNLRCEEVVALLEGLGFVVRDGRKQGHKVVTHPVLDDFLSTSFSCGHGRNPIVKAAYAVILKRVLTIHADALRDHLTR